MTQRWWTTSTPSSARACSNCSTTRARRSRRIPGPHEAPSIVSETAAHGGDAAARRHAACDTHRFEADRRQVGVQELIDLRDRLLAPVRRRREVEDAVLVLVPARNRDA